MSHLVPDYDSGEVIGQAIARTHSLNAYISFLASRFAQISQQLRRNKLAWALRCVWAFVVGLSVFVLCHAIPLLYTYVIVIQPQPLDPASLVITAEQARLLRHIGLTPSDYGFMIVGARLAFVLVFVAVSGFIMWQRPTHPVAVMVATFLVTFATTGATDQSLLIRTHPLAYQASELLQLPGTALILFILYLFPDGRFVPRWTRLLAWVWLALNGAWYIWPNLWFNPLYGETWLRTFWASLLFSEAWMLSGFAAMIYRYRFRVNPTQRQQMRAVLFTWLLALFAGALYICAPVLLYRWAIQFDGAIRLIWNVGFYLVVGLCISTGAMSFALSVLNHRLWGVERTLRRTLYWLITSSVLLSTFGFLVLILLRLIGQIDPVSRSSVWAYVGYAALLVLLLRPLYLRAQSWVNYRFDRPRVNADKECVRFADEIHAIPQQHSPEASPEALLKTLLNRTIQLFRTSYGAIMLQDEVGNRRLVAQANLPNFAGQSLQGHLVANTTLPTLMQLDHFPLCVALRTMRQDRFECVGQLLLGPRLSEQPYSNKDRKLLLRLSDQVGTAMVVTQFAAFEHELTVHQNSSASRAATYVRRWQSLPHTLLQELDGLVHDACNQPAIHEILEALPQLAAQSDMMALRNLSEGYLYLLNSQSNPELCAVGLRKLLGALAHPQATLWSGQADFEALFKIYLDWQTVQHAKDLCRLSDLRGSGPPANWHRHESLLLAQVGLVVQALNLSERANLTQDRLTCLGEAMQHAQHLATMAQAGRGVLSIVASQAGLRWESLLHQAQHQLQTEAKLRCHLVTRQVIALQDNLDDIADTGASQSHRHNTLVLAFDVHNEGLSPAREISVELLRDTLQPSTAKGAFERVSAWQHISVLPPGGIVRIQFEIRPHLAQLLSTHTNSHINTHENDTGVHKRTSILLPLSLAMRYTDAANDTTGTDHSLTCQVQVNILLAPAFRPIPNPYRAGPPLLPFSPVFVGRDEDIAFVSNQLERSHTHLVISGERRMGKTSLVRQLVARLGPRIAPVMLDGQLLGINSDLSMLLFEVALEICNALDVPPPDGELFNLHPAQAFENIFLPAVLPAFKGGRLVLFIDEFEELEMRIQQGRLDSEVCAVLRHLMQNHPEISLVFVGSQTAQLQTTSHWAKLLNSTLQHHLGALQRRNALQLAMEPVAELLAYDDLALDKLMKLTGGHPYFLQVFCQTLVDDANTERRSVVLAEHVQQAKFKVLELSANQLQDIWNTSTAEECQLMLELCRLKPDVNKDLLDAASQRLVRREILSVANNAAESTAKPVYEWRLGIMQAWIQKNRK
jgi:hypothetical protein